MKTLHVKCLSTTTAKTGFGRRKVSLVYVEWILIGSGGNIAGSNGALHAIAAWLAELSSLTIFTP